MKYKSVLGIDFKDIWGLRVRVYQLVDEKGITHAAVTFAGTVCMSRCYDAEVENIINDYYEEWNEEVNQ